MQRPFAFHAVAAAILFGMSASAFAHISYSGRDFGSLVDGSNVTISTQSVTSNYGWADASDLSLVFNSTLASTPRVDEASFISGTGTDDLYLGDSHKGRAFRLHLGDTLSVTFTESARNNSGLMPALSVYKGLAALSPFPAGQTSADHDFAVASEAWRTTYAQAHAGASYDYLATQGSWNALGNWCLGGDGDAAGVSSALSCFQYVGSAASTVLGGTASATLTLGPGDYTVFVGGNNLAGKGVADSVKSYALTLGVSAAVAPVPEPQTWLLMCGGLALLALRRRSSTAL